jgi:gliding motility-associated protein GldC
MGTDDSAHFFIEIFLRTAMKKSEINITVTLDDQNMPLNIDWSASDMDAHNVSKAMMLSLWDGAAQNTLRIDLWTKEMMVEEMQLFFHQNLLSMADTLERATNETEAAKAMRTFAQEFGERMKLVMKNPFPSMTEQ